MCLLAITGWGVLLLGGCVPSASSNAEENEAHFLKGKARVSSLDYRGAIESFEEALVVNPRSGAAHFELGMLYAEREADPAAAIYHYQKFLQLRPGAPNADIILQHIFRLKQDLAKALLPLPATPGVQREFEQLAEDNRRLKGELERLKSYLAARGLSVSNPIPAPVVEGRMAALPENPPPARSGVSRTHRVQAGESPLAISRKYNIKLNEFMAANPGLVATRMQVGQIVNIPGQ